MRFLTVSLVAFLFFSSRNEIRAGFMVSTDASYSSTIGPAGVKFQWDGTVKGKQSVLNQKGESGGSTATFFAQAGKVAFPDPKGLFKVMAEAHSGATPDASTTGLFTVSANWSDHLAILPLVPNNPQTLLNPFAERLKFQVDGLVESAGFPSGNQTAFSLSLYGANSITSRSKSAEVHAISPGVTGFSGFDDNPRPGTVTITGVTQDGLPVTGLSMTAGYVSIDVPATLELVNGTLIPDPLDWSVSAKLTLSTFAFQEISAFAKGDFSNTISLASVTFVDADGNEVTPESLGYTLVFDSGMTSPNLFDQTPTPEPSTLILAGLGAASLLGSAWRRRKHNLRSC
jgi:hypothetical protein